MIYYDLETISLENIVITQIGAVTEDDFFGGYWECSDAWAKDYTALARYNDEKELLKAFGDWLRGKTDVTRVSKKGNNFKVARSVGFNSNVFDDNVLRERTSEHNVWVPLELPSLDLLFMARMIQHMQWTRRSLALRDLVDYYDLGPYREHNALADARVLMKLHQNLLVNLRQCVLK